MYPHERSLVESMQGRPFTLLGVNNDDELSTAKNAVKENNLTWRSWYDGSSGPIVEKFEINSFPTIFVIDHTGVIRYKDIRGEELEEAIKLLVAEAEAAGMKGGPPPPPKPVYRVFTAATGQYTAGTFKSYSDGVVILEKKDGTEVKIKLKDLSKKDIAYLTENHYVTDQTDESGATQPVTTDETSQNDLREFTDLTGKFKVQARLLRVNGDKAVLEKSDGKEIEVPLEKLSEADQEYVKSKSK